MAYTIRLFSQHPNAKSEPKFPRNFEERLRKALTKAGVSAKVILFSEERRRSSVSQGARPCSTCSVEGIRLLKPKPYCGNHPGPCDVGAGIVNPLKKKRAMYLEWVDWVTVHRHINDLLDKVAAAMPDTFADVFTLPQEVDGRLWIRRKGVRRHRYDYLEHRGVFGRPQRAWIRGDGEDVISSLQYAPLGKHDLVSIGYDAPGPLREGTNNLLRELG